MKGLSRLAEELDLPAPGGGPIDRTLVGADGTRLHALDRGGDGAPVLLLHGGALTAHTWDHVCLALRHQYRCLCLDLRGHGDSDWVDSCRIDDDVADVHAVIAAMGWRRPHLAGMSLGGVVAAYAALQARDFAPASLTMVDVAPACASAKPPVCAGRSRVRCLLAEDAERDIEAIYRYVAHYDAVEGPMPSWPNLKLLVASWRACPSAGIFPRSWSRSTFRIFAKSTTSRIASSTWAGRSSSVAYWTDAATCKACCSAG